MMRLIKKLRDHIRTEEIRRTEAALRYVPYKPAELGKTRGKK